MPDTGYENPASGIGHREIDIAQKTYKKKKYLQDNTTPAMARRPTDNTKAWLIIDSTIKEKRGGKLHNLQKFKTSHGYVIGHCFVFTRLVCEDGTEYSVAVKPYFTRRYCKRSNKEFNTKPTCG